MNFLMTELDKSIDEIIIKSIRQFINQPDNGLFDQSSKLTNQMIDYSSINQSNNHLIN